MIIRIVKMHFAEENIPIFLTVFREKQGQIGSFPGCSGVSLLQSVQDPGIVFTYSQWQDEGALEKYRKSPLFRETWATVKPLFIRAAEAWSVKNISAG